MQPVFDGEAFTKQLRETVIWCNYQIAQNPQTALERLRSIVPSADKSPTLFFLDDDKRANLVRAVIAERSMLVKKLRLAAQNNFEQSFRSGRLLIQFIYSCAFDNAAAIGSSGFFDGENYSPQSTWIYFYDSRNDDAHILSWVPGEYIDKVEKAISMISDYSLHWVEPTITRIPYIDQLKLLLRE